mmetsp:Transcript_92109/g.288219  ORF Transcript_92109/g.288219 Transcript_92109/m.288219 type:complete len:244 (-) Transcript_92109:159-890(-)
MSSGMISLRARGAQIRSGTLWQPRALSRQGRRQTRRLVHGPGRHLHQVAATRRGPQPGLPRAARAVAAAGAAGPACLGHSPRWIRAAGAAASPAAVLGPGSSIARGLGAALLVHRPPPQVLLDVLDVDLAVTCEVQLVEVPQHVPEVAACEDVAPHEQVAQELEAVDAALLALLLAVDALLPHLPGEVVDRNQGALVQARDLDEAAGGRPLTLQELYQLPQEAPKHWDPYEHCARDDELSYDC